MSKFVQREQNLTFRNNEQTGDLNNENNATKEKQFHKEGESNRNIKDDIEKSKKLLNDSFKDQVTRVLDKNSEKDEQTNFQQASDLRNWIDDLKPEQLYKLNQNKCFKIIDVNDKFKFHFKSENEFCTWFFPDKQNKVTEILLNYKTKLEKSINELNPLKRKRKNMEKFEEKFKSYKESKMFQIWKYINKQETKDPKLENQLNLQKNKIKFNTKHRIKTKFILDEKIRYQIIKLANQKFKYTEIAKKLNLKQNTVRSSVLRFQKARSHRQFSRQEVHRLKLSSFQVNEIDAHIDKHFGPGDNAKTLVNHIKAKYGIEVKYSQAYSLIRQFGNKKVEFKTVQYDSNTKSQTLARHLFNLQIISNQIKSNIEIFTLDEFGLYVSRKGKQIQVKPSINKFQKSNSNYDKKYNVCIGCSKNEGVISVQVSERPQNSALFHEFMIKMRDQIVEMNLNGGNEVNILMDDAAFHGWAPTMAEVEEGEGHVSITHLGGMISMFNPCEYFIHLIKSRYRELPNDGPLPALHSLQEIIKGIDRKDALKCYKCAANTWIRSLTDISDKLKNRLSIN